MKNRKKISIVLLGFLVATVLLACGKKSAAKDQSDSYLCYLNEERTGIVQREYGQPQGTIQKQLDYVIRQLSVNAKDLSWQSPLPEGVTIEKARYENHQVLVYLKGQYNNVTVADQVLCRGAIVETLVQLPKVEGVTMYVDGQPMTDEKGRELDLQQGDDFVQNTGSALHSYQAATLTLYFGNKSGEGLAKEKVSVRHNSNTSMEKLVMEQLMKGPVASGDQAIIPDGTNLLGVSVKDRICYVNLDDGFVNTPLDLKPEVQIYAIVNSIVANGNVDSVQISINGESNIRYLEAVDLSQPLTEDRELIQR